MQPATAFAGLDFGGHFRESEAVLEVLLIALLVISVLIWRELIIIQRELVGQRANSDRQLEQAELDDILKYTCPKLFRNFLYRQELRLWIVRVRQRKADSLDPENTLVNSPKVYWHDIYSELWDEVRSEIPAVGTDLLGAATNGNRYAQLKMLGDFSCAFENSERQQFGLTRAEASFLLYRFWREMGGLPFSAAEQRVDTRGYLVIFAGDEMVSRN